MKYKLLIDEKDNGDLFQYLWKANGGEFIMSNAYREWEEDRSHEAWETMHDIVEIFDNDGIDDFDKFDKIKEILERDNWI